MKTTSTAHSFHGDSMNNILSHCGLVDAKISASEKDLPVLLMMLIGKEAICASVRFLMSFGVKNTPLEVKLRIKVHHKCVNDYFLSNIYYLINRKYNRQVNWWVYFLDTYASSIKGDAEMSRYQEIVFGLYNFNAAKKLLLTKTIILFMTFQRHWLWSFTFGDTKLGTQFPHIVPPLNSFCGQNLPIINIFTAWFHQFRIPNSNLLLHFLPFFCQIYITS